MVKKRRFERVECRTEALINYKDQTLKGEVENLSLKGLFVKTDQKIDLDEPVGVTVFFNGDSGQFSFSLKGKVVHVLENGIGINFQKIDVDSLVHTMTCPTSATEAEVDEICSSLEEEYPITEKLSA